MADPHITYRYHDDGRLVHAQCSSAHRFIARDLASPHRQEDARAYRGWLEAQGHDAETVAALAEPAPELQPEPQDGDEPPAPAAADPGAGAPDGGEGWPPGYTYEQGGAYFLVHEPGGDVVVSDTPSGKWNGEAAAREAAWAHFNQHPQGEG